ncbi:hypothetical protein Fuma_02643 [Fuerstiella marisgermanici]|uniref:Uncharacterized protein n=1 Tax=Fuerstiella marisgermanici TaxID=1891926 RepID=A0A1P8WG63_9PLAN|nr:hypothetical protein Fuma_02643 [Fuerstiella marisgermanici]
MDYRLAADRRKGTTSSEELEQFTFFRERFGLVANSIHSTKRLYRGHKSV